MERTRIEVSVFNLIAKESIDDDFSRFLFFPTRAKKFHFPRLNGGALITALAPPRPGIIPKEACHDFSEVATREPRNRKEAARWG